MMNTIVGTTTVVVALNSEDVYHLSAEQSLPVIAAMKWTVREVAGMTEEDDKKT